MAILVNLIRRHNKMAKVKKLENDERYSIDDLIEIMSQLRNPDGGCPWDLEQDFKSIAPHTIEEAYEVADAIDNNDMQNLREELGDLLFQSVFHAQMASEEQHFDLHDVIHDISAKMVYRHPHVFGDKSATSASDVNSIWDEQKSKEKKSYEGKSALDGVPLALPSLLRAQKLQKKAAKTGFEWTKAEDILDKLEEEIGEFRDAAASNSLQDKREELGDMLFVVANLGRIMGINPEEALRDCNTKFERRFNGMEDDLSKEDKVISDLTLEEMTQLWVKQKQKEFK